jgi:hypothetical protein
MVVSVHPLSPAVSLMYATSFLKLSLERGRLQAWCYMEWKAAVLRSMGQHDVIEIQRCV